ncbi:MAG: hypothetical protein GY820_22375 [Gammaproteobacteria bacterium]|nr:hypothetical protein [Gammaproteobacteria bacterium]
MYETKKVLDQTSSLETGTTFSLKYGNGGESEAPAEIWGMSNSRIELQQLGEQKTATLSAAEESDEEEQPSPEQLLFPKRKNKRKEFLRHSPSPGLVLWSLLQSKIPNSIPSLKDTLCRKYGTVSYSEFFA